MRSKSIREQLDRSVPFLLGGAHDALSGRLVEETGFDGIWLSSLGVSTALRAIPDLNLIGLSEMCGVAKNIAARVSIPIIADCENGYGDVNNVTFAVREYERAGVSAVAIEDNVFPKQNSFYAAKRTLLPVDDMVAKICAAREARQSPDFLIIARTEALIAGGEVGEARTRALAYADAGADALIIHSRHWSNLQSFTDDFHLPIPLSAIPTTFPHVTVPELFAAGFRIIIYANQPLRAATLAMRSVLNDIRSGLPWSTIDRSLSSMEELETLVGLEEFPDYRPVAKRV